MQIDAFPKMISANWIHQFCLEFEQEMHCMCIIYSHMHTIHTLFCSIKIDIPFKIWLSKSPFIPQNEDQVCGETWNLLYFSSGVRNKYIYIIFSKRYIKILSILYMLIHLTSCKILCVCTFTNTATPKRNACIIICEMIISKLVNFYP